MIACIEDIPLAEKVAIIDSLVASLDLQHLRDLIAQGDQVIAQGAVPDEYKECVDQATPRAKLLLFYAIELARCEPHGRMK
jgi:hypothetical protein